jgi:hypothetical protein
MQAESSALVMHAAFATLMSALACLAAAHAGAVPMNGLHEACYVAPDNATWRIFTQLQPAALVNVSRALPHSHTVFRIIMGAVKPPEDGDWTQGLALAQTLQQEGFFPTMSRVTAAQWAQRNLVSLISDEISFATEDHGNISFTSMSCPGYNNCPYAGGYPGHCWDRLDEYCCGDYTMDAQCVSALGPQQCCRWYDDVAICNATQTCCGGGGPGASSYAFCCGEGASCCTAQQGLDGESTCCAADTTCCEGESLGLCCQAGEVCDAANDQCVPKP